VPTSNSDTENACVWEKHVIRQWYQPYRRCHCYSTEQERWLATLSLPLLVKSGRNLLLLIKGGYKSPIIYLLHWFPLIFLTFPSLNAPNVVRLTIFRRLYTEQCAGSRLPAVANYVQFYQTCNIASRTHTLWILPVKQKLTFSKPVFRITACKSFWCVLTAMNQLARFREDAKKLNTMTENRLIIVLTSYAPRTFWEISVAARVMPMKNSNDTIGNRSRELTVCSAVPQPLRQHGTNTVQILVHAHNFNTNSW
jgi:hypothetical protein